MLDRLFVYGTLMRGHDNPMSRLLSAEADFIAPASIRGRLYRVRHYPALTPSDDASDRVFGELFRLHRPHELLLQLDVYESCGPDDPAPAEYRREIHTVTLGAGAPSEAWTYIYNWPVAQLPRIASGRFKAPEG
jgi:gamma-glutamylcyclotransferase (GGCT)/AIG2-like uncharacterized protein YtfP